MIFWFNLFLEWFLVCIYIVLCYGINIGIKMFFIVKYDYIYYFLVMVLVFVFKIGLEVFKLSYKNVIGEDNRFLNFFIFLISFYLLL